MPRGVNQVANAVMVMLGPKGRGVLFGASFGAADDHEVRSHG